MLFVCAAVAERKLLIPGWRMLIVGHLLSVWDLLSFGRRCEWTLTVAHASCSFSLQLFMLLGLVGMFGGQASTCTPVLVCAVV